MIIYFIYNFLIMSLWIGSSVYLIIEHHPYWACVTLLGAFGTIGSARYKG